MVGGFAPFGGEVAGAKRADEAEAKGGGVRSDHLRIAAYGERGRLGEDVGGEVASDPHALGVGARPRRSADAVSAEGEAGVAGAAGRCLGSGSPRGPSGRGVAYGRCTAMRLAAPPASATGASIRLARADAVVDREHTSFRLFDSAAPFGLLRPLAAQLVLDAKPFPELRAGVEYGRPPLRRAAGAGVGPRGGEWKGAEPAPQNNDEDGPETYAEKITRWC